MIPNDEGRKSNGSRHDRKVPAHDRCAVPLSAADKFVEIKNRSNNLSQRRKLHNIVFFACRDRCAVPLSAADKFVEIKNRSNNLSQRRKLHNIVFFACRSHTDRYRFFRRSFIFLERFKIEIIKLS